MTRPGHDWPGTQWSVVACEERCDSTTAPPNRPAWAPRRTRSWDRARAAPRHERQLTGEPAHELPHPPRPDRRRAGLLACPPALGRRDPGGARGHRRRRHPRHGARSCRRRVASPNDWTPVPLTVTSAVTAAVRRGRAPEAAIQGAFLERSVTPLDARTLSGTPGRTSPSVLARHPAAYASPSPMTARGAVPRLADDSSRPAAVPTLTTDTAERAWAAAGATPGPLRRGVRCCTTPDVRPAHGSWSGRPREDRAARRRACGHAARECRGSVSMTSLRVTAR